MLSYIVYVCVWVLTCLWFAGLRSVFSSAWYSHLQAKLELPGGAEHQTQAVPQGETYANITQNNDGTAAFNMDSVHREGGNSYLLKRPVEFKNNYNNYHKHY